MIDRVLYPTTILKANAYRKVDVRAIGHPTSDKRGRCYYMIICTPSKYTHAQEGGSGRCGFEKSVDQSGATQPRELYTMRA